MQIAEPTTMVTDYILGAFSLWAGLRVLGAARAAGHKAQGYWGISFIVAGLGAFVGGSMHGFRPMMTEEQATVLWLATLGSAALASCLMLFAVGEDRLSTLGRRILLPLAAVKLILVLIANFLLKIFIVAILDYGSSMLFVLIVYAWSYNRRHDRAALLICAGVIISFIAAGVQMSGFTLHEHFNYNDLFHVIQIVAMYLFYRGTMALSERRIETPA